MTPRSRTRSSTSIGLAQRSVRPKRCRNTEWKSRTPKLIEPRRLGGPPAHHAVAHGKANHTRPVDHRCRRPLVHDGQAHLLGRLEDEGPVEEHVGRDRGEHHGLQARRDDRTAGREVVGGGAGRRRDEYPVGEIGEKRAPGDVDRHVDGVSGLGPLHDGVVEGREPPWPAPGELDFEGHALLDEIVAREHLLEGGLDPGRLDSGEVAHAAQVHPQHGHAGRQDEIHCPQHRPVAAEAHGELDVVAKQDRGLPPGLADLDHIAGPGSPTTSWLWWPAAMQPVARDGPREGRTP